MLELVGLGHNCVDTLARVPAMIDFDENGRLSELGTGIGGPATTAMVAAQRLGASTTVIGVVGDDAPGAAVLDALRREGVRTDLMRVTKGGLSQVAVVLIRESDGKRAILARQGPENESGLSAADRERIARARVLHLDGKLMPLAQEAARFARERGVLVSLDANTLKPDIGTLVGLTDYLITSAHFPRAFFADFTDYDAAARRFLALGPRVVVTTFGEKGSRTWTREGEVFDRPTFPVEVVDTTGAGDVFHGAYVYGLARGWNRTYITDFASACAAMKCRQLGGQPGIPTLPALRAFLAERGVENPD
ncbi:MAG: carbohydrate kinase family protein [Chloroflexota bacterium]